MQKICGILDVNSFEIRCPDDEQISGDQLRGIYKEAAFMSHDCIGNAHVSLNDFFEMTIHASVPIKSGQAIFFNYANPFEVSVHTNPVLSRHFIITFYFKKKIVFCFQCTAARQQRLKKGKYFNCFCKRCTDPTELGTYSGSIICPRCHEGCIISQNPLSDSSGWNCEKCNHFFYDQLIKATIVEGQNLLSDVDETNSTQLESLLKKCLKSFPQNNHVIIEIKQKLITALRDALRNQMNPQKKILIKIIRFCREMINFLEIIEPGISRHKGEKFIST